MAEVPWRHRNLGTSKLTLVLLDRADKSSLFRRLPRSFTSPWGLLGPMWGLLGAIFVDWEVGASCLEYHR